MVVGYELGAKTSSGDCGSIKLQFGDPNNPQFYAIIPNRSLKRPKRALRFDTQLTMFV